MERPLAGERSPYLKKAAGQPVNWLPYSEEAFRRAKAEDKPVFLSSGTAWCHWCHVQARESFEDVETAGILNANFICIKIDRDERPDIDRRCQEALAAMGSGGGWPLSIFLTPEGRPFYGGTYFPPEDAMGRPGFKKVLNEVAKFYRENKDRIEEYSNRVIEHIRPAPLGKNPLSESFLEEAAQEILNCFDPQNGGFGKSPKFPMPGAIGFLAGRYFFTRSPAIGEAVKKTLEMMAKGGIHDQLAGGFHRYSTDEAWIIPHFEKMAEDNAWLLKNYVAAFHLFGLPLFRETALGIIDFAKTVLSDTGGGFYSSQDADVTPEDEGGYFTWTPEDFNKTLDAEERRIASMHLLHERGEMPHGRDRKMVLFVAMEPEEISGKTGVPVRRVKELMAPARKKLLHERAKRQFPFVDKTLYSSINGLFISAYLSAWRLFGDGYLLDFAIKSLSKILKENFRDGVLYRTGDVKGLLDDHVHMLGALLDVYENTGAAEHIEQAGAVAHALERDFLDKDNAGFFDSAEEVAGLRLKNIEDIPHPSANALAAWHLFRLSTMTGKEDYKKLAEQSLGAFLSLARELGVHCGAYFMALDGFYNHMSLNVGADADSALAQTARKAFRPYKIIFYGREGGGAVTPCIRGRCLEPVSDPAVLAGLLSGPGKSKS
ncbi:MAG: thioredoxin domain-containing protein [Nitrospiraceae bacterium]|nr:thioredoxin domain-containing protein [Nitrospiraceae bacterium]